MDLLIIGGTVFVGRHAAEAAMQRAHRVTLFHRGSKGTGLISGAEEILGDRNESLDALLSRKWDAVIDTCGYVPRVVTRSAEALKDCVGRYLFVSSISVYEEDENGVLHEPDPAKTPDTEEITGDSYGPLKGACERVLGRVYGTRASIVRPGLIAGPYDPTNRFTYWVDRMGSGEDVLIPERADQPIELIDARDLGQFMVECLEKESGETHDAVGDQTTFGAMIEACQLLNPATNIVWAPHEFLEQNQVLYWQDLPLTTPPNRGNPLLRIDSAPAKAAGLRLRPIKATAEDTFAWFKEVGRPEKASHGLAREKEIELISKLKGLVVSSGLD